MAKEEPTAIKRAMGLLARRDYCTARLREKLAQKHDIPEVEAALARLTELRLLDDRAYAERFARDRFERGGYGRHRIRRDLQQRGIPDADIEAAIASELGEAGRLGEDGQDAEREAAARALQKFRRRPAGDDPAKRHQAEFRHLVTRGFPTAVVRDLLGVSL